MMLLAIGHGVLLGYIGSASLSRFEQENLTKKLASLESALLSLGESSRNSLRLLRPLWSIA